jgi:hypothetical protein
MKERENIKRLKDNREGHREKGSIHRSFALEIFGT